jgi:glyoxylase-like metal-dependent hydrolase (beta-lactamase superfamily II)
VVEAAQASSVIRIGNVEVRSIVDSQFSIPSAMAFATVAEEERARHFGESCTLTISSFLVRSGGRTLLVDTGIGPTGNPGFGIAPGTLPEQLAGAGVRPEDVDLVVLTHLHVDHVGWNTVEQDGRRAPRFPNARYLVREGELTYWKNPELWQNAPIEAQVLPLEEAGAIDTYDGEHRLTEDLTLIPSPGHTPGHTTIAIASAGEHGFILGDVAHHPAQITAPEHGPAFDVDPEQARASRRGLFDRAVEVNGLLIAGHFPPPGFGRVAVADGRRYWQGV